MAIFNTASNGETSPPVQQQQQQQQQQLPLGAFPIDMEQQRQQHGRAASPAKRGGKAAAAAAGGAVNHYKSLRAFLMTCVTWSATLTSCLGPFFPIHMKEKFGASSMAVGLVFSVTSITQFLVCPNVSRLSRRVGRPNTLRLGLLIIIAGGLVFGLPDRVPGYFVGRILQGVGDGFIDNSSLALLMRYSPDLRRDVGLLEGASSLGYLFGPVLAGLLYSVVGFRAIFFLFTAPFAAFLLLVTLWPALVLPPPERRLWPPPGRGPVVEASEAEAQQQEAEAEAEEERARANRGITLRRVLKALASTPTLPTYIAMVLTVSGALGWFDTSLAEHIYLALDVSTFKAGLFFTVQIVVYVPFSFVAAEVAYRVGEWRAILAGTLVWSAAMLTIGPIPALHPHIPTHRGALAVIAGSLAVLGASEAFVFLPFVPLFHSRFRRHLGWTAEDTEDVVASVWSTTWAAGQTLGPLLGGLLMDTVPPVPEIGCSVSRQQRNPLPEEALEGGPCKCAFPWTAVVFGGVGFALCAILGGLLLRAQCAKGQRWVLHRLSSLSQSARAWRSSSSSFASSFSSSTHPAAAAGGSEGDDNGEAGGGSAGTTPNVSMRALPTTTTTAADGQQQQEEEAFNPPFLPRLEQNQSSSYRGGIRPRRVVLAWSKQGRKRKRKKKKKKQSERAAVGGNV